MTRSGRMLCAATLLVASLPGWALFKHDCAAPGTAVLGAYRERWFLINMAASYACLGLALLVVLRPGRRWVGRTALVHAGILLAVALAEAAAYMGLVDFDALLPRHEETRATHLQESPDPRLRWATRPGLRSEGTTRPSFHRVMGLPAEPVPYRFESDRFGFRNPSDKAEAPVICLGDSMVVAGLVPVEETVTERLEVLLGVPVMNGAEVGYSPQEELIRLRATDLSLAGRVVLQFVFEGNDLADSRKWRGFGDQTFRSAWPRSGLVKTLLAHLHRPLACVADRRFGSFPAADGALIPVWFWLDGKVVSSEMGEFPEIERTVVDAYRELRSADCVYAAVFVPTKIAVMHPFCSWPASSDLSDPDTWESGFGARLAEVCEREGIPFLNLTPGLQEYARRGMLPYLAKDEHMNAVGQSAMAELLAPWIREQLLP